jgi:hypothetical protein
LIRGDSTLPNWLVVSKRLMESMILELQPNLYSVLKHSFQHTNNMYAKLTNKFETSNISNPQPDIMTHTVYTMEHVINTPLIIKTKTYDQL